MNILYLTNHLNVGGITSYVLSLAKGLKKRGHNVYIASSGGELLPRFIEEGITYIPIPIKTKSEISYKILASLFKLLKYIQENKIDIIHANTRVTQVLSSLIQRFSHIPYISTCHGFFKKRLSRRMFPCWGLKVIAISESVKEHLEKDFKVGEEKIRVIHHGIDVGKFKIQIPKSKIDIKKELGLGDGPVIGIIARLSEEKGHSYIIEAMRDVVNKNPLAQLLIIGEGRMKEKLVNLSKTLRLEKNVVFQPSVLDMQKVLSIMDIFILYSLKEGLGLSLIEAQAYGLCVIGSDIGGIKDLIKDGYNGLLVEPANSKRLAQAILDLLNNPLKRESLGKNARVFIQENFSYDKMIHQTEGVYLECLSAKD